MRDTPNALAADVYLPSASGSWPVILIQTPYSKASFIAPFVLNGSDPLLESPHYAFVVLDWRGFFASSGAAYSGSPTRGEDGYDAVEWIAAQSWCDGNVGTWGASALGNVQMKTAEQQPPHLKGCVPIVYHYREWYDQNYIGGVYARARNNFVYSYFGSGTLVRAHPLYDFVWSVAEAVGDPGDINVPTLSISGWYDHEPVQTIREWRAMQTGGGPAAIGAHKLLIGPWSHSHVGDADQGELAYPDAEFESSRIALAFFDHHLRGIDNGYDDRPPVSYYRLNTAAWVAAGDWPPTGTSERVYFLRADGALSPSPSDTPNESLGYLADPGNPVPSLCGPLLDDPAQGPCDQRPLESRQDVLTFDTGVLAQDLTVEGNVRANIWISSDTVDTDVAVRLCDVYPDGRSMLMVSGIRRASLRNGYTSREFLQPGQSYEVEVELSPVSITFPAGHSIRLMVSPSHYELFDVNFQDGSSLSDEAGATATSANVSVWMDVARPSRIVLPALPQPDITAPELGPIAAQPASALPGDGVDFTVAANEPLQPSPTLTVNGDIAQYLGESKSGSHLFYYAIPLNAPPGPATLVASGLDLAGNPGSATDTGAFTILEPSEHPMPTADLYLAGLAMALCGLGGIRRAIRNRAVHLP